MTLKNKPFKRLTSLVLTLALVMTCLPASLFTASAASAAPVADGSTADGWKDFFPIGTDNISTENAGGIWTDKSVFAGNAFGITKETDEDFLVALSAIGSNMSITGQTSVPTDTVLILDVSGSMDGSEDDLVSATNQSLQQLLSNSESRVGIVLYSGTSASYTNPNAGVVLLPLGHYRTASDGVYIRHNTFGRNDHIELDTDVVYDGGANDGQRPNTTSKEVNGATYIQKGLSVALEQFEDNVGTKAKDAKPIVVLMSDGAPTLGNVNFTTVSGNNFGTGGNSTAALGFVTQLTAAYTKLKIEEEYGTAPLFYTLGLGTGNDSIATSVLNPSNTLNNTAANSIREYWTNYNALSTGQTIYLGNNRNVTKIAETLDRNYVDRYFEASDSSQMVQAFQQIIDDIALQSKYYPTLVEGAQENSGFISFVDKIGKYMNVTEIKGILIHNTLFSGADLASNFVEGQNALGTVENPTELGDQLVWAVREHLGLVKEGEDLLVGSQRARTLIELAYKNEQLSYTDDNNFSNYIGWYANKDGEYLGFWHEGITTMPDPNDTSLTDETRPYYIIKSYGYLGETDETKGVDKSNMLYATVQVREEILTGDQTMTFAVPAALIPTITYEVTLDENEDLEELKTSGADSPMRLVYGVALDEKINAWSLRDQVDSAYITKNSENGAIKFYANQFESDGSEGYGKVNAYSYFRPSFENDRYYYQENAYIYNSDETLYEGTAKPQGTGYLHKVDVYEIKNGVKQVTSIYEGLLPATLNDSEQDGDNWYIPAGHVRRDYADVYVPKSPDNTNVALYFSASPFADIGDPDSESTNHRFIFGSTLGNNGLLTIEPETGIKITKTLEEGATPTQTPFEFELQGPTSLNGTYTAFYRENGVSTQTSVNFTNGNATVSIKAGQTLYIGGLTAGDSITVSEVITEKYVLSSVDGDADKETATLTVVANNFAGTEFVNHDRGFGALAISKEIHHDFGATYVIPEKTFTMSLTLTGEALKNSYDAVITHLDNTTTPTQLAFTAGVAQITLKHGEQIVISELPEGTVATVVENEPGTGFAPKYSVDDAQAVTGNGVVTIKNDITSWIDVQNFYTATSVSPDLEINGVKVLDAQENFTGDFEFKLQRYVGGQTEWETIDTQTVSYTNELGGQKNFSFGKVLNTQVFDTVGKTYYRVTETVGNNPRMTYDEVLHSFTINVTDDNMDGALEITVTTTRPEVIDVTNEGDVTATFTNHLRAEATTQAFIEVQKAITDLSGSEKGKDLSNYTFELSGDGIATPIELTTNNRGVVRFPLEYKESDMDGLNEKTFTYSLKEVAPATYDNTVWTYDASVYTVEVKVTKTVGTGGEVSLSAVVTDNGQNTTNADNLIAVNFTNEFNPKDAELTIDFVKKTLEGREFKEGDTFNFGVYKIVNTQGEEVATGTNDLNGVVTFNTSIVFDKVGYYDFEIKETSVDVADDGVTNDKNVYKMVVVVTDDPDNSDALKATYTLLNQADVVEFKNVYEAKDFDFVLKGNKVLNGKVLVNDEFGFEMVKCDVNGIVENGATVLTARNLTNGEFSFPKITFTTDDVGKTYYYKVRETVPTGDKYGIVYDEPDYIVKVEVYDNLEGEIGIKPLSYKIVDGEDKDTLTFTNEYIPSKADVPMAGNKILEGAVISEYDGQFSFRLYSATDNTYSNLKLEETVKNDANGEFSFSQLSFDKAGTYYYVVDEVNGGETINNVTYDDTEYRIEVRVVDNLRGQLIPSVYVFDTENVPQANIEFNNTYIFDPDAIKVEIDVKKTIKGFGSNGYSPKGFEFLIEKAGTDNFATVKSDKNGDAKFVLEFDKYDINQTYTYYVSEIKGNRMNVIYSKAVYAIKITLSLNDQNEIVATAEKEGIAVPIDDIVTEFINVYTNIPEKPDNPRNPPTGGVIR